jgi:ubiquinone/menaquinone biosynthesis C-methylase UbiE
MKLKSKINKYWNKQPCNIKHSKKRIGSKEYFKEVTSKRYFVEKHIKNFAEFKKYKNKNVLEIGCGIGTDAMEFIKNGANYYGIEFSEKSLHIAKNRYELLKKKNQRAKFFKGDAENLDKLISIRGIKFHLIYSFGVIHHTHDMQKCFDSIYKVANKNTEIKIMLYSKNSYKNFLIKKSSYRYEAQKNCPVVYKVDENDLDGLIKNKFKTIFIKQDFIFPYQIKPYKNNKYVKIEHFKCMPKKVFKILEKKIGEHMLIKLKKK